MSLRHVLIITSLTLRETTRRRILWVLLILALASVAVVGWGVDRLVSYAHDHDVDELQIRLGVSQVLIFIAFMFSFVLAMSAAFLAAPAIASDVESGTVHALLARPMGRADLLVGRWIGLSIVVSIYASLSGLLAIGVVGWISGHVPPEPLTAVGFLAAESVCTLTLALALGTRLPAVAAGAISVVLFALSWFGGVLGSVTGLLGGEDPMGAGLEVLRWALPMDVLWHGVVYGLEPPLVVLLATGFDVRALTVNPFFAADPPPGTQVAWAAVWVVLVLTAGVALFRRREL